MENSAKPDLKTGFPFDKLTDGGMPLGQVDGEDVILARRGDELFAVGASCTHYQGPLAEGLIVGETVRCPWHHACFSLRTGEALRAPALDPIACWRVEKIDDEAYVREKLVDAHPKATLGTKTSHSLPSSIVIIGGGAAGLAAADMLRREGYDGRITMISADDSVPYDRPNLSKDFLAGTASDDWIPLRSHDFYKGCRIDLALGSRVSSLDLQQKRIQLENGKTYGFESLLIATGAEPVRLKIEGATETQIKDAATSRPMKLAPTIATRLADAALATIALLSAKVRR
jgi:nitrite reductase/ring-hydroxylating ferredoxin subunit